ncbi:hypothetical protein OG700_23800 [Streptomyces sp. NBC_01508]
MDCLAHLISAWCVTPIRTTRPPPTTDDQPARMLPAVRDGLSYVIHHRIRRPLVLALSAHAYAHAYADGLVITYFVCTLLTELHAGSTGPAVVMGVTGAGGLLGALTGPRLAARFGPGPPLLAGFFGYAVCGVPLLLAQPGPAWLAALATAGFLRTAGAVAAGTTQRALRQLLCPANLQSRAAQETSVWLVAGIRPLDARGPR